MTRIATPARLTTTALALILATGTAWAESHTAAEDAEQNMEQAAEETEQAAEDAAQATENAAEEAAQATENAAEDAAAETEEAMEETEQAAENATEETEQAAENAAEETEEAMDETAEAAGDMLDNDNANLIRTRDITGGPVYSVDTENGMAEISAQDYTEVNENWTKIGEIEDIVLSTSGEFKGVVVEVGGFLGIGDKHVYLPVDSIKLVPVDDKTYSLAVGQTEEQLEEMESVDEGFWN